MFSAFVISVVPILAALFVGYQAAGNADTFVRITKPPLFESKAIYLTAYTAGSTRLREPLVKLVEGTELNSVIIDIKDASGLVFYNSQVPLTQELDSVQVRLPDIQEFLAELKQKGIYRIARMVVFQDPHFASARPDIALKRADGSLWRDYKGLAWVDPTRHEVWKYNLDIAKEAVALGFDEINFDYIRFPSDGNIRQIVYENMPEGVEKHHVMREFFEYLNHEMARVPARTSADLFGMTLLRGDGLNIGQRIEDASPNFDFIMPMVYPSHYPPGHNGFANPADYPYEIVYDSLDKYSEKAGTGKALLRPWLQDFDLGAVYTSQMLRAQIQANTDANGFGWAFWNARNVYTPGGFNSEAPVVIEN